MAEHWTVAICCPHPLIAEGLVRMLTEGGYEVTHVTETTEALMEAVADTCPDIVLIEYLVLGPDMSPIPDLVQLGCAVAVLADPAQDGTIARPAIQAGARGYLSTDDSMEKFLQAMALVAGGSIVVSERLGELVWHEGSPVEEQPTHVIPKLSARESQIALLLATGARNKQIAAELGVTEFTVASHIKSILSKLDLRNRQQIAAYVAQQGLLDVRHRHLE